jgi:hypothetical protein
MPHPDGGVRGSRADPSRFGLESAPPATIVPPGRHAHTRRGGGSPHRAPERIAPRTNCCRTSGPEIVSQICHAFVEPGRHRRTPEGTKAGEIEYRRTREEQAGHGRTRHTQGSGPCDRRIPGIDSQYDSHFVGRWQPPANVSGFRLTTFHLVRTLADAGGR